MPFSEYLEGKREACRALVSALSDSFAYVGILGTDVRAKVISANRHTASIVEGGLSERGFVVKLHNGGAFFEYSLDDISGDIDALARRIRRAFEQPLPQTIDCPPPADEPIIRSFVRESDFDAYSDEALLSFCTELKDQLLAADERIVNASVLVQPYTVDKLFLSKHRSLDQHYGWANAYMSVLYRDARPVSARETACGNKLSDVLETLRAKRAALPEKAKRLAKAKPIVPGVYDVITDPSISGLIAHEAFGHGVEMDQFVKDRALAKQYVGKPVASPVCNMRDGAAATLSAASYFFDDDGVLAHDTQIIRDGILVAGLCDLASACQLSVEPTGNGRRESYKRKAYSRMTNTFFDAGKDKLEDMIASIEHGYMLFETNNGMEDPKNWQIQCTAEYGIEIVNGKLTENYVSPVVLSGSVPELLQSISMVSDECVVIGSGSCGKGYKEWVRVADGGPALKARVKLA